MPKFVCKNCAFRFLSESDRTDGMCPYCGERKLIRDESAEDLVNSADEDGRTKN